VYPEELCFERGKYGPWWGRGALGSHGGKRWSIKHAVYEAAGLFNNALPSPFLAVYF
jgi:hypothetical protein